MNGLDLFSGIGGISLALEPWVKTIAYCESEKYAQSVLLSRMADGTLRRAPIWDEVTTLRASMLPKEIDIIFGGFPCQDISVAGKGIGLGGKRSGLFFEIIRLTKETGAPFVFLENVPAIRTRGLREVIGAFTEMGYDCRWTCLSAASIGAPHKRERWFLLAHAHSTKLWDSNKPKREASPKLRNYGEKESLADSMCEGLESNINSRGAKEKVSPSPDNGTDQHNNFSRQWWATEPDVDRVVNGVQFRSHRIKCLGNSVVPLQVREAFKKLIGIEKVT